MTASLLSLAAAPAPVVPHRPTPRWLAVIVYRSNEGPSFASHDLDEIEDLHDIVERGPHWDTVERIEIVRAGAWTLTLEQAEAI